MFMPSPEIHSASFSRPNGGWLKSIRVAQGLSLRVVAERLKVSPQAVHQFEGSEVAGTISLRQLENVARAMGHRVIYALQPRDALPTDNSSPPEIVAAPIKAIASPADEIVAHRSPHSVEHSMFLENQAADRYD